MYTIPDKGEALNDIQSIDFQQDWEIIVAGIDGKDCVLSGGACTEQGVPDMTVAVAKAAVLSNGVLFPVAAGNVTITAADATNPRLDYIVVTSAGAKAVRAGTPAAAPKPPDRSANDVVLAQVYIPANDTAITNSQIYSRRMMRTQGPIEIYKDITPVATNTSAAAITVFSLVVPSGLFLAGKIIHIRCGGNWLHNSGTPTLTITLSYGGTTVLAVTTTATTVADPDRSTWIMDIDLVAQASNDQHMSGLFMYQVSAPSTPTTGIANANGQTASNFNGSCAVDSDAADRTILITLTQSVSNVANEIVKEYGLATIQ